MSNTPILSVVRVKKNPTFLPFEESPLFKGEFYEENFTKSECRKFYEEHIQETKVRAGKYLKSGGGGWTNSIQEAQIFGWSPRAKKNAHLYLEANKELGDVYEVLPVLIREAR